MIRGSAVRYFLVVSPAAVWMRAALAMAALTGIATLWLNPKEVDAALGSVLLLQMFSCSNGYAAAASRGYFDPILLSGRSRSSLAAANLTAAALPGVAAWLAVIATAAALGQGAAAGALHRQMAFVLVSCTAWSVGLPLPRLTAGALWALVLVALAMSRSGFADYLHSVQTMPVDGRQVGLSAAAGVVCPFLLLSDFPGVRHPVVFLIQGLAAAGIAAMGIRGVARREYPLGELP